MYSVELFWFRFVLEHCLNCYGVRNESDGVTYRLDEEKVCKYYAEYILRPVRGKVSCTDISTSWFRFFLSSGETISLVTLFRAGFLSVAYLRVANLAWLGNSCWITSGHTIHPPIERLFDNIEPTLFQNSASKLAGLQVYATATVSSSSPCKKLIIICVILDCII